MLLLKVEVAPSDPFSTGKKQRDRLPISCDATSNCEIFLGNYMSNYIISRVYSLR